MKARILSIAGCGVAMVLMVGCGADENAAEFPIVDLSAGNWSSTSALVNSCEQGCYPYASCSKECSLGYGLTITCGDYGMCTYYPPQQPTYTGPSPSFGDAMTFMMSGAITTLWHFPSNGSPKLYQKASTLIEQTVDDVADAHYRDLLYSGWRFRVRLLDLDADVSLGSAGPTMWFEDVDGTFNYETGEIEVSFDWELEFTPGSDFSVYAGVTLQDSPDPSISLDDIDFRMGGSFTLQMQVQQNGVTISTNSMFSNNVWATVDANPRVCLIARRWLCIRPNINQYLEESFETGMGDDFIFPYLEQSNALYAGVLKAYVSHANALQQQGEGFEADMLARVDQAESQLDSWEAQWLDAYTYGTSLLESFYDSLP